MSDSFCTRYVGMRGEKKAEQFLIDRGYQILQKNFRTKFGEIDLVTIHNNFLVFIEVKSRKNNKFGYPEEAVTKSKVYKISKVAQYFIKRYSNLPKKIKIEVVAINEEENSIRLIEVDNI